MTVVFLLVWIPAVDSTTQALLWEAVLTCLGATVCPVSSLMDPGSVCSGFPLLHKSSDFQAPYAQ